MITELSDAAAGLIAELPNEASDLTSPQLDAMAELLNEIADRLGLSETRIDAMLVLTRRRGYRGVGERLDYLTSDERATFEDGEGRGLDATLAHDALARWGERSGWSDWLERRSRPSNRD